MPVRTRLPLHALRLVPTASAFGRLLAPQGMTLVPARRLPGRQAPRDAPLACLRGAPLRIVVCLPPPARRTGSLHSPQPEVRLLQTRHRSHASRAPLGPGCHDHPAGHRSERRSAVSGVRLAAPAVTAARGTHRAPITQPRQEAASLRLLPCRSCSERLHCAGASRGRHYSPRARRVQSFPAGTRESLQRRA